MPLTHYVPKNSLEKELLSLEDELIAWQKKWVELHKKMPEEKIQNYQLNTWGGQKLLLDVFGDQEELILVHNMGKSCRYCTLWADGINGSLGHFENRVALAVLSPDSPDVQKEFALSRGWSFQMLSGLGSSIIKDLGFENEEGCFAPGFSVLVKKGSEIIRKTRTGFCPGDLYCSVWHFFALLPSSESQKWAPQFKY